MPSRLPRRAARLLLFLLVMLLAALGESEEAGPVSSLGTLVTCQPAAEKNDQQPRCLWAAQGGQLVSAPVLRDVMVDTYMPDAPVEKKSEAARRLEAHMQRLEEVQTYADLVGHQFSYRLGVTQRHLTSASDTTPHTLPQVFVNRELEAAKSRIPLRRRLDGSSNINVTPNTASPTMIASTRSSWGSSHKSLNWCASNNPAGRTICTAIKSQANCGSCWAFAATDVIEAAVALNSNLSSPVTLSTQQFLSCSTRDTENTFKYCWVDGDPNLSGMPWLSNSIRWKSENEGCNGGMTHGAFMDAIQLNFGLLPEIAMPYVDANGNSTTTPCIRSSNLSVASITDWKYIGNDCTASKDPTVILRQALESQPIAVAVNSGEEFKDYKGGYYVCPNNGIIPSKDDVNHALVLVGYDTDPVQGDYWILKNSYGSEWGDKGFMKLLADNKVNCGLNIFPVVPLGAAARVSNITVDGGGTDEMLGLTEGNWIMIAVVATIATILLTIGGVIFSNKRRLALRDQVSGDTSISEQMRVYE